MASDSSPLVLLLDDGELDDVRSALHELGVGFAVKRGAAGHQALLPADLLVTTPRYLLASHHPSQGLEAVPRLVSIVVVDDCPQAMRRMLERAACDFVVRRPVHPAALLHLLRRTLYHGPERRRLQRVAIGAPVKLRTGWRSRVATLVDLSLPGCRLLSTRPVERGRSVTVTLPGELAGGKSLRLSGRVVRVQEVQNGGTGAQAIGVAFDSLDSRTALTLRAVLAAHSTGPASLKEAPGRTRAQGSVSGTDSGGATTGTPQESPRAAPAAGEGDSASAGVEERGREAVPRPQAGSAPNVGCQSRHRDGKPLDSSPRAGEAPGRLAGRAGRRSASSDHERSPEQLEESGDNLLAAAAYRAAGDLLGAARCYERAHDLENALECYRTTRETEKVIALFEQLGDFFEAGKSAAKAGQWERAIHDLQQVDAGHGQYGQACDLLAWLRSERDEAGTGGEARRKEGGQPPPELASITGHDLSAVADALERANADSAAHLVRATWYRERGDTDSAAREFEAAGHLSESAELRRANSDHERSAQLFEEAGVYARAAEEYHTVRDLMSAARCYERACDFANAISSYRAAGDMEKVIALLEKTGDFFEAGKSAAEVMQWERAVHDLQQVDARHGHYGQACDLLAELLSGRGELDLAIEKLEEALRFTGADDAPLGMQERYAKLLEEAGRSQDALDAYERIGRRDPSNSDVSMRVEALRKELSRLGAGAPGVAGEAAENDGRSRYEILDELGRGGMGVVHKARDRHLGRIVALKVLPENMRNHPSAPAFFEREARYAATLNHPNIVTVYDAGQENGNYFISMEYLEGAGLDAVLREHGCLETRELASLGVQIAAGLDYAQQNRIVHRDIKPSNLFLTRNRVVKIMDFGLAKMMEEVRRSSTVIGGTPNFMAPEQAVGEAVDHRTDLYSLGATFFQLVTGAVPFEKGDAAYCHVHAPPPDPRECLATIPAAMAELILQLMAKKPEDRCQSAREVGERLREILEA